MQQMVEAEGSGVLADRSHRCRYDLALAGAAIMRDSGWKTPHMVTLYTRGARAREGALANLLRSKERVK